MNFLEYHNWIDERERFLRGRYFTFRIALNLLYQMKNRSIVETGCTRWPNDSGAGGSTVLFGDFCSRYGGHLTTIDLNPDYMEDCKRTTIDYAKCIDYIVGDSVEVISNYRDLIDLLYLDSMDVPDFGDASEGQKHNLRELQAAEKLLHPGSVILIDDNNMENGGKSRLTKLYLEDHGYKLLFNYDQSLWLTP